MKTSYDKIEKLCEELWQASWSHWIEDDFLARHWWLNIALTIAPWIIWAVVVDKKRLKELLLYGGFICTISIWLDTIGSSMVLWTYPNRLLPAIPPFEPFDMGLIPVTYMIIYQYYGKKLKTFLFVVIGMALVIAFIAEPIFHSIGYYKLIKWKFYYSFPIYIFMALSSRFLILKIIKKEDQAGGSIRE